MTQAEESDTNYHFDGTPSAYLFHILAPLTLYPEQIGIQEQIDHIGMLLTVRLHEGDLGKVIGHKGNTLKAIRQLVKIYGFGKRIKVGVKVLSPEL